MELNSKQKNILLLLRLTGKKPMSPLQIMKSLFLYAQEKKPSGFYEFTPYLYGPCSFAVYSDLKKLTRENFITAHPTHRHWSLYGITPEGERQIAEGKQEIEGLREIKEEVLSKSFVDLLKYVYSKYPQFASKSIINKEILKSL